MVNGFDMLCEVNYMEDDIVCDGIGNVVAQFVQKHKKDVVKPVDAGDDWRPPFQSFLIEPAVSGEAAEEYTYYVTYDVEKNAFTVKVDSAHEYNQYGEMSLEQFERLCKISVVEEVLQELKIQLREELSRATNNLMVESVDS